MPHMLKTHKKVNSLYLTLWVPLHSARACKSSAYLKIENSSEIIELLKLEVDSMEKLEKEEEE